MQLRGLCFYNSVCNFKQIKALKPWAFQTRPLLHFHYSLLQFIKSHSQAQDNHFNPTQLGHKDLRQSAHSRKLFMQANRCLHLLIFCCGFCSLWANQRSGKTYQQDKSQTSFNALQPCLEQDSACKTVRKSSLWIVAEIKYMNTNAASCNFRQSEICFFLTSLRS